MPNKLTQQQLETLAEKIKTWGIELGFQQVGITDTDLSKYEERLNEWLKKKYHGEMDYMQKHGTKRSRPAELVPGTQRIISVRMDYLPPSPKFMEVVKDKKRAFISRYATGRDYHKVLRKRLQQLADKITAEIGPFGYRAFTDSAPVMEKALAEKAGLGWIAKNTNVINSKAGSYFFIGELYTDLPLPIDEPASEHCGSCTACLDVCPTKAIVAPFQLDARRCISYLTIELKGSIPEEFRSAIGNRVYGCDDCQLCCPWNKFAKPTDEKDFRPRHDLDTVTILECFNWSEKEFLKKTEGSAIRRIGYERWLRNMAIGLGNALAKDPHDSAIKQALLDKKDHPSELVREHVVWALAQEFV